MTMMICFSNSNRIASQKSPSLLSREEEEEKTIYHDETTTTTTTMTSFVSR